MKAAELFVKCLEAEGVNYIFGVPGEEILDFLEAIRTSTITFIPTRHEQGAAFMANAWGRLTGRPGVCLSTLGPGATNLITGVADAFLDHSPMVAITGQTDLLSLHKESHQHIDTVSIFRPITKWSARIERASIIPEVVRKAFLLSVIEKPGPTHIELPEDVAVENTSEKPIIPSDISYPEPDPHLIKHAVRALFEARNPLILAGNGVLRAKASSALKRFAEQTNVAVTTSFMGMGAVPADSRFFLSTTGLQAKDYISCGFDKADLIIAVGYDPVEFSPEFWNPDKDKKIIHIDFTPAEIDAHYSAIELLGDISVTLTVLSESVNFQKKPFYYSKLKKTIDAFFPPRRIRQGEKEVHGFPLKPLKVVQEIRRNLKRDDILISDVGAHKMWIARFYPAYEPNTAIISNGFASMGFALPAAISAKMLNPDKNIIAAIGDAGFLMSVAELETAVRLMLPIVCIIFNDGGYGLISWKQKIRFGNDFGCRFGNPDFVMLAESFGAKGYRVNADDELGPIIKDALSQERPSVIDCPVDYSENLKLTETLGKLICPI